MALPYGFLRNPIFATVHQFEPNAQGPELWAPAFLLASHWLGVVDAAYAAWWLGLEAADLKPFEARMRLNHMLPVGATQLPPEIVNRWSGVTGSLQLLTDAQVLLGMMYRTKDGQYGFTPEGREAV